MVYNISHIYILYIHILYTLTVNINASYTLGGCTRCIGVRVNLSSVNLVFNLVLTRLY